MKGPWASRVHSVEPGTTLPVQNLPNVWSQWCISAIPHNLTLKPHRGGRTLLSYVCPENVQGSAHAFGNFAIFPTSKFSSFSQTQIGLHHPAGLAFPLCQLQLICLFLWSPSVSLLWATFTAGLCICYSLPSPKYSVWRANGCLGRSLMRASWKARPCYPQHLTSFVNGTDG